MIGNTLKTFSFVYPDIIRLITHEYAFKDTIPFDYLFFLHIDSTGNIADYPVIK